MEAFVNDAIALCQPDRVYVCTGSDPEFTALMQIQLDIGAGLLAANCDQVGVLKHVLRSQAPESHQAPQQLHCVDGSPRHSPLREGHIYLLQSQGLI